MAKKATKKTAASQGQNRKTFSVAGKSVEQLLSLTADEMARLTEKELRSVTTRLVSAANKRIARIRSSGVTYTPAMHVLYEAGRTRFDVKSKKTKQSLAREYNLLKQFFKNKTSSLSGYKKFAKRFLKEFGVSPEAVLQDKDKQNLFESFNKLMEHFRHEYPGLYYSMTASERREFVWSVVNRDDDFPTMVSKFEEKVTKYYEDMFAGAPDDSSDWVDIDGNSGEWEDVGYDEIPFE